jgi:MoxR-like ATPase
MAGEVLELLAEDRRLQEFFKQNQLLMLPLEEEVVFLRQCSDNFPVYADLLRSLQPAEGSAPRSPRGLEARVTLMAAAAGALVEPAEDPYLRVLRRDEQSPPGQDRDGLLSAYERIVLFGSLEIDRVRAALKAQVVDQDEAVDALCDEFALFAAGTRDRRKPPSFFLVGPTGVGKNHLVESLVRLLEGVWETEIPLLTLEGPSYTYPSDINELRGATRGFIRSDEEGLLATFHERAARAPLSVILVDEVEKAHPQLRTFFLSILDRGTTTDNRGRVLGFGSTMVFFTSNLGYSDAQQQAAPIGFQDEADRAATSDADVRREIRRGLAPEFANRLRVVHFRRLGHASAGRILDLEMERIARRYREAHGLDLRLTPAAREELLARGFSPTDGARRLSAVLESVCNVEVAKRILRDAQRVSGSHATIVGWLREIRDGSRSFDAAEVRRRVEELTRARLGYSMLEIGFVDGEFVYVPVAGERP